MKAWLQRRTLRFRLALWYGAGGTLLLAGFSATMYNYVSERMAQPLDAQLRRDLAVIQSHLAISPNGHVLWDGGELPGRSGWMARNPWFELWDDKGRLVTRMWPFTDSRVEQMPTAPTPGRETISVFNVAEDLRLRTLSVPYQVPGNSAGWMIRVMRVHEPVADALGALRLIILVALPVVIALLVLGGYWVTRRWLEPLDRMLDEANRITASDLSRRITVQNPHDELGKLAAVFNVTLDRLEASFAALDRFVADASHELRTPLTTLRSVGEVGLRRSRTVEEYREIIGSMLEDAQRLEMLVQRLLELASAESGDAVPHRSELSVKEFVESCIAELSILADAKQQRLVVDAEPCKVVTDAVIFRQALQNLIDNAVKYSPESTTIHVTVRALVDDVEVAVADEGPGIPPEHRERLTERFFRRDRARGWRRAGFGLGLAITNAYMRVLRGRLEYRSREPCGSVFSLVVPKS